MGKTGHFWRFVFWPISVWMSFRQFERHDADDYVELTSPIMAAALAFWGVVAWALYIVALKGLLADLQILLIFLPLTYAAGLALYFNRERNVGH